LTGGDPDPGELHVAGADQDASYPPEMAVRLEKALSDAGVVYRAEIYAGAKHGWMTVRSSRLSV